jgi:lysophospholipase L1-like esterase
VLNQDPLLVIIEFGGNDFLTNIPREVTEKNIRQMIDSIQARGAMVALVDISAGMLFAEYHSLLSRVAREKNAILIPKALAGIITNPSLKSDFVHPNAKGYLILAQRILAVILPYLNQNSIKKGV